VVLTHQTNQTSQTNQYQSKVEKAMSDFPEIKYKETKQLAELEKVNANGDSYDFLVAVRRSPAVPLTMKVRVARELLQYERAKLGVSVSIQYQGDFAAALDRAIQRSNGKKVEGSLPRTIEHDADELKQQMLPIPSPRMRRV
jgi:hypothetical protein